MKAFLFNYTLTINILLDIANEIKYHHHFISLLASSGTGLVAENFCSSAPNKNPCGVLMVFHATATIMVQQMH